MLKLLEQFYFRQGYLILMLYLQSYITVMYSSPVPTAFVDAPVSDGPFANDPALSGSSTYAVQSYVTVMYALFCLI